MPGIELRLQSSRSKLVTLTIVVPIVGPALFVAIVMTGALVARNETLRTRLRPHVVRKSDFGALLLLLVARGSTLRGRRHGPVVDHALQVHAQLFHFGESRGRDVVAALALDLLLHHPAELFRRFDKDVPQTKGIDRANTTTFWLFGLHVAPFRGGEQDSAAQTAWT